MIIHCGPKVRNSSMSVSSFHDMIFGSMEGRRASQLVADCCLSRSMITTRCLVEASIPAILVLSVDLPAPPLGLAIRIVNIGEV